MSADVPETLIPPSTFPRVQRIAMHVRLMVSQGWPVREAFDTAWEFLTSTGRRSS